MNIIKSKKEIQKIFETGQRVSGPFFLIIFTESINDYPRVAFIAGKKIGKAPYRNRCKRVLRECVRLNQDVLPCKDIVFVARSRTGLVGSETLYSSFLSLIPKCN